MTQRSGRIHLLELHNFKSYGGAVAIGPFRAFTAIVGPNGSGKSNIMDAISFVLGVRTEHLRGRLKDLLYDRGSGHATHGGVKLVYEQSDGQRIEFSRGIVPSRPSPDGHYTSEYRIDGQVATAEAYLQRLQSYGVLVKARNFLVFQARSLRGERTDVGLRCVDE